MAGGRGWALTGCCTPLPAVALNYQSEGRMLQLNRAKFSANGSCGYVLKPQCMCQGEARGPGDTGAGVQRPQAAQCQAETCRAELGSLTPPTCPGFSVRSPARGVSLTSSSSLSPGSPHLSPAPGPPSTMLPVTGQPRGTSCAQVTQWHRRDQHTGPSARAGVDLPFLPGWDSHPVAGARGQRGHAGGEIQPYTPPPRRLQPQF